MPFGDDSIAVARHVRVELRAVFWVDEALEYYCTVLMEAFECLLQTRDRVGASCELFWVDGNYA